MANIAFDVHGTLDNDADGMLMRILDSCLLKGDKVFIISGPPADQVEREISALGMDPANVTIISVVDWLESKNVEMWQDDKDTWWCNDHDWWASKGKICAENKIDMIFDDKIQYKEHMPETTKFVLWEGTTDVSYFGKGGKSDPLAK